MITRSEYDEAWLETRFSILRKNNDVQMMMGYWETVERFWEQECRAHASGTTVSRELCQFAQNIVDRESRHAVEGREVDYDVKEMAEAILNHRAIVQ